MYNDLEFSVPETGKMNLKFDPAPPAFNKMDKIDVGPDEIDQYFDEYEQIFFSEHMRQYYGMVKCIDFNVVSTFILSSLKIDGMILTIHVSLAQIPHQTRENYLKS